MQISEIFGIKKLPNLNGGLNWLHRASIRAIGAVLALFSGVCSADAEQYGNLYCRPHATIRTSCEYSNGSGFYGHCVHGGSNTLSFGTTANQRTIAYVLQSLGLCKTDGGRIMAYSGIDGLGGGLSCAESNKNLDAISGISVDYCGYSSSGWANTICSAQQIAIFKLSSGSIYIQDSEGYSVKAYYVMCDFSSGFDSPSCKLTMSAPTCVGIQPWDSWAQIPVGTGVQVTFNNGSGCTREFQDYFNSYINSNAKTGFCDTSGTTSSPRVVSVTLDATGMLLLMEYFDTYDGPYLLSFNSMTPELCAGTDCWHHADAYITDFSYAFPVCIPETCNSADGYIKNTRGLAVEISGWSQCSSGMNLECLEFVAGHDLWSWPVFCPQCKDVIQASGTQAPVWVGPDGRQVIGDSQNMYLDPSRGTGFEACRYKGGTRSIKTDIGSGTAIMSDCYWTD